MKASDILSVVVTFALAVLLVVGATAGAGVVLGDGQSPTTAQPSAPAYKTGALLPNPVSEDGAITSPEAETKNTVVVDMSHGNDVSRADMQPLVDALVSSGHEVRFFSGGSSGYGLASSSGSSPLNKTLRNADAFIVANPASSYNNKEVNGIEAFADAGGRVLILADTATQASSSSPSIIPGISSGGSISATGQPTNVAGRFGITFGSGYLYDMTDNANNFQYIYGSAAGDNAVSTGANQTVFRKAVPVVTGGEATPVLTSEDVRLSSTRKGGNYAVAVRDGSVLAVGDTWFLSPEAATLADNEQLVSNVASFLVTGDKEPGAPKKASPSTPSFGGSSPVSSSGTGSTNASA
ncbi:hypothetical protein C499_06950 [Halogeometricum borinquense DSM 11551]|uniref:DUF4350 domain-containing protein n=2 Tax=Halogeometricum borinquense TaxID=60847 RepID=E4NVN6_HALBP|nr:DUF4350 domain-containing protein [Halogeometricum borinquense]ADQ68920.1 hypothetical protein Hbor_33980 [Halogeometricum borinquense DSM 11551]ELY28950.1 hypothetical protein C499_06950 [Halogeometricum borinquense DSM 11551]RYJ08117.1 hypothetical protein ELS19_16190 [Halogeometricum borinquense]